MKQLLKELVTPLLALLAPGLWSMQLCLEERAGCLCVRVGHTWQTHQAWLSTYSVSVTVCSGLSLVLPLMWQLLLGPNHGKEREG